MGKVTDISNTFELIAKHHPGIGHNPNANPPRKRFYGYNLDEANAADRVDLGYPRMGMALKTIAGLNGQYESLFGSVRDTMYIELVLLDKAPTNDYAKEYDCYDRMKKVMDDIVTWINFGVTTDLKFKYPVLSYINVTKITYSRVKYVGQEASFGWKISIPLVDEMYYDPSTNPLDSLTNL